MAKKLYGAAAAARKKRLAKMKRKRTRVSNPAEKRKSAKRVAAGKKAAATRKRNKLKKAYHSGASSYAKGVAKSKRRKTKRKATTKRRAASRGKLTKAQRSAASKKGWRNRRRKGTAPKRRRTKMTAVQKKRRANYGLTTLRKARKSTKSIRSRKGNWAAKRYARRHGFYKINPSNGMLDAVKQVLPIAGSFYVSKLVSRKLNDLPVVNNLTGKLPLNLGAPVLSGVILAAAHYGTKKGALSKHRTGLMLGTALAFVDSLISALAPADVKAMMGIGEYVSMNDYVSVNEYVSSGEYVSMGGVITPGHGEPAYNYDDPNVHGLYAIDGIHDIHAIHGIDQELGAIEAGVDTGNNNGIFANGW